MPKPAAKGDWIRSQPRDLPFEELQKRAKTAGHGLLSRTYANKVRSEMPAPNGHSNGHTDASADTGDTAGQQFLKLLRVIGTRQARKLLDVFENGQ